jgi:hypothetical protein
MVRLKAPAASPAHCYACSRDGIDLLMLLFVETVIGGRRLAIRLGRQLYAADRSTLAWDQGLLPSPSHARALPCVTGRFALETGFRSRLPRHLLENSLHDAGADAELLADLEDAITAGLTRRRPSFVPFALARASPALTRSLIIPRSNSANTPSI